MSNPTETPGRGTDGPLARIGLRGRLLAAILLVAVTTVAVGGIGIQRMSAISEQAEQVYAEGAVQLDGLRELQANWWELSAYNARVAITSLPPETLAGIQVQATESAKTLAANTTSVAEMSLTAEAEAAFTEFSAAAEAYLTAMAELEQIGLDEQDPAALMDVLETMNTQEAVIADSLAEATSAASAHADQIAREAQDAYGSARTLMLLIILGGVVISVLLALRVVRSVTRPVQRVRETLDQVAAGDLSVRVGESGGAEIGEVARSLDHTLDSLGTVLGLVGDSATRLAAASHQLTAAADGIAEDARTAAGQADVVVTSAGDVASSVDTVANGSQQMEHAIREIAQNATAAAEVAGQAVSVAETTTQTVGKLGDSSQQIAAVVKLINGIAEQTNLLALNATIEAARAGESGKGFAVVANEVKELAQETARATEDISARVDTIQADTAGAVTAIGQISSVIGEINDYQATIAAAVEEQTATTNEMNRNVGEAADSSRGIAAAMTGLAAGTQQTTARATEAQRASADLAQMSAELQEAVSRFTL